MGDPQIQALRGEADALAAAESVGQQHRHMAGEGSPTAFEHQGQPGVQGIGAQTPEPYLGHFREFAGIVVGPRPEQLKLQLARHRHQGLHAGGLQGSQGGEIKLPDLPGGDGKRQERRLRSVGGHQEL